MFYPTVIEKTSKGDFSYDIYSKFLKDRIIFLNNIISEDNSNLINNQIKYLNLCNKEDIIIYINSSGGDVYCGLSIYDSIVNSESKVNTICLGLACSMAAIILSSGFNGKRFSYPNSRIMLHQPVGNSKGQVSDIKIQTKEIIYLKKKLNFILLKNISKKYKILKKKINRDYFMSPLKALNLNIIDHIKLIF